MHTCPHPREHRDSRTQTHKTHCPEHTGTSHPHPAPPPGPAHEPRWEAGGERNSNCHLNCSLPRCLGLLAGGHLGLGGESWKVAKKNRPFSGSAQADRPPAGDGVSQE